MNNATERFSNRVDNYVKYRPGYPPELLDYLRNEVGLTPDWKIADIASGTGLSSLGFLENGNHVYGIEPNRAMREASISFLTDFDRFEALDGTSDKTGLPDESVEMAYSAQAFHWFCNAKTAAEFRRIVKRHGFAVIVWNERELAKDAFHKDYEAFLKRFASDYEEIRHDKITGRVLKNVFGSEFEAGVFENHQVFDFEGLKGRMLSSSYMPDEASPVYSEIIENLELLFAEYEENGRITVFYQTNLYYCQF